MCGIVGFTGNRQAAPILLDGLSNLIEKTDAGNALKGTCGIGHTRWASAIFSHKCYKKD